MEEYWITEDGIRSTSYYPSQEIEYRFEGSTANPSKVVESSKLEDAISESK